MPTHPSSASTFCTHLRLLDLDQRDDWPSITAQILSAKDAQQNQKKRIQCVEWALYRLFETWDPDETSHKLQPFFPPLAPLQSLNLRAALYRSLNELKKNGALGREVTIRKTMLDECKGEKFEEVLAAFSTLVLQKRLATEKQHNTTIAKRLALAPVLKSEERKSLLPLSIAHRASLTAVLHRKEQLRSRYQEFQRLLDEKSQTLRQKHEHVMQAGKADPTSGVSERSLQKIRQRYDTRWQGDPRWLDTILNGDITQDHDVLLEMPFEDTWRRVAGGAHLHFQTSREQENILQDLESRVATQQARLQRWQEYRKKLAAETILNTSEASTDEPKKLALGSTIDFGAHKAINVQQTEILRDTPKPAVNKNRAATTPLDEEYARLVNSMKRDLDDIDAPKEHTSIVPGTRGLPRSSGHYPRSALDLLDTPTVRPRRNKDEPPKKRDEVLVRDNPSQPPRNQKQGQISSTAPQRTGGLGTKSAVAAPVNDTPQVNGSSSTIGSEKQIPSFTTTLDHHSTVEIDEDSMLAAEIIAATMNAGPSPIKSNPSLVERTRRSMALASPGDSYQMSSESTDQRTQHAEAPLPSLPNGQQDTNATLLERTRRSMSILPAQQRVTRRSTHKHRPSKQYPANQFETPQKQPPILEDLEDMTPPEKLFSEDADYASVFKSRPKIAVSPTASPAPEGSPGIRQKGSAIPNQSALVG